MVSRKRAAARIGVYAIALAAAAFGAYVLLDGRDLKPRAVADAPHATGEAPTLEASDAPAVHAEASGAGEGLQSGPAAAGNGVQIGSFIDPDAPAERRADAPIHIGEYIDADDDSPARSASDAVRHIGEPLDPDE